MKESTQLAYAKACGKMYRAPVFANGDTRKQLLAREYLSALQEGILMDSVSKNTGRNSFRCPEIKKGYLRLCG